jgi:hypothetical protein
MDAIMERTAADGGSVIVLISTITFVWLLLLLLLAIHDVVVERRVRSLRGR